ncbi:universal stress protein [Pannonibacter phragmitetus]|uniref:universal stress protein n=1 Tax=Pannonibacter phragmitetus TaxID=121719 RepID=UPI003D2F34CC
MTARTITALLDASVYAPSVCEHAVWAASRLGLPVDLVHVLVRKAVHSADYSGSIALGARTALLSELARLDEERARVAHEHGRAILDDAEALVRERGVAAVSSRLRHGEVVEAVTGVEAGAELLVVGKRGEAADFETLHLGSNLERLARSVSRPLLVAARSFRPVEKVLVAFDGGPSAVKAVDYMARSPLFSGLHIHLLMAGDPTTAQKASLSVAEDKLKSAGFEVLTSIVPGDPELVISSAVEHNGIGLLVMGAYGHSRLRSLIIGSTTTQMLRSCKVPVLLFR